MPKKKKILLEIAFCLCFFNVFLKPFLDFFRRIFWEVQQSSFPHDQVLSVGYPLWAICDGVSFFFKKNDFSVYSNK